MHLHVFPVGRQTCVLLRNMLGIAITAGNYVLYPTRERADEQMYVCMCVCVPILRWSGVAITTTVTTT